MVDRLYEWLNGGQAGCKAGWMVGSDGLQA